MSFFCRIHVLEVVFEDNVFFTRTGLREHEADCQICAVIFYFSWMNPQEIVRPLCGQAESEGVEAGWWQISPTTHSLLMFDSNGHIKKH